MEIFFAKFRRIMQEVCDKALAGIQQRLDHLAEESKRRKNVLKSDLQQQFDRLAKELRRQEDVLTTSLQQKLDEALQKTRERESGLLEIVRRSYKEVRSLRKELQSLRELSVGPETGENGVNSDCSDLFRVCLEHIIPVGEPLVLISQAPRSGGTLLSQLFDGHPECHAHPYELYIGYPDENQWPILDLHDDPSRWFEILFETRSDKLFREGYQKSNKESGEEQETFPFLLLPSLQKEIFVKCLENEKVFSLRQILDAYMTSYFNAWLNNQNLSGPKKVLTAFTARLAMYEDSVARFFAAYPDGKLISILRHPYSWYVSARKGLVRVRRGSLEEAMAFWKASTDAMVKNKRNYGERVCIVRFEDLVEKTEPVMRRLADYAGIQFDEILLTPTFNKFPIKANSSYPVKTYGVINEPISRHAELLSQAEMNTMDDLVGDPYKTASEEAMHVA